MRGQPFWSAWVLASLMLSAVPSAAGTESTPEQVAGHALVKEMRRMQPQSSFTNQATLEIRDPSGRRKRVPLTIETQVNAAPDAGWSTRYVTQPAAPALPESVTILQFPDRLPTYLFEGGGRNGAEVLPAGQGSVPIAGSDFWADDLGLEFLHWPEQRIIPGPRDNPPMIKGRACKILESRNPAGAPYSRVVSWVDNEFKSLIQADAYDSAGKLLKRFGIGSFKKVDGVWLLKDMEMIDERRDTKTRLEFELKVAP